MRCIANIGCAALSVCAILAVAQPARAVEYDCMIEPRRVVTISGSVEAPITAVRVDRGDFVAKGEVVVEFESGVERASAALSKYRAEMNGAIAARQSRVDFAQGRLGRRVQLTKQNYVSRQDLEESEAEARLAEAELTEALDNRRLAELEHRRAVEMVRIRSLTSPVAGVVVERSMHPGEVADLSRTPILKIAEIDVLHVEVILPVVAYGSIAQGSLAQVMPEAPIGGRYEAKVAVIDRVLDAASGTFGARLELPNPKRLLPAGIRCRVEFVGMPAGKVPARSTPRKDR